MALFFFALGTYQHLLFLVAVGKSLFLELLHYRSTGPAHVLRIMQNGMFPLGEVRGRRCDNDECEEGGLSLASKKRRTESQDWIAREPTIYIPQRSSDKAPPTRSMAGDVYSSISSGVCGANSPFQLSSRLL
jgi:hypothetical protein